MEGMLIEDEIMELDQKMPDFIFIDCRMDGADCVYMVGRQAGRRVGI